MITVAEDPRGKLPKEFSICASFYRSHHFWYLIVENNMKICLSLINFMDIDKNLHISGHWFIVLCLKRLENAHSRRQQGNETPSPAWRWLQLNISLTKVWLNIVHSKGWPSSQGWGRHWHRPLLQVEKTLARSLVVDILIQSLTQNENDDVIFYSFEINNMHAWRTITITIMIISATTIITIKISQDKQHARVLHDEEHRLRPHRRGSESFAEVIHGNHYKKAHITITIKNHHF